MRHSGDLGSQDTTLTNCNPFWFAIRHAKLINKASRRPPPSIQDDWTSEKFVSWRDGENISIKASVGSIPNNVGVGIDRESIKNEFFIVKNIFYRVLESLGC